MGDLKTVLERFEGHLTYIKGMIERALSKIANDGAKYNEGDKNFNEIPIRKLAKTKKVIDSSNIKNRAHELNVQALKILRDFRQ